MLRDLSALTALYHWAYDDADKTIHIITVAADGTVTDHGPVKVDPATSQPVGPSVAINKGSSVNITTVSQLVVPANPSRKKVGLQNVSDTLIDLALGGVAVASCGIALAAALDANTPGGSIELSGADYTGPIAAIHAGSGSKALRIWEV
jgi:hypothetical protein